MGKMQVVNNSFSAGFFACCSTKLVRLIEYYKKWQKVPEYIDGTFLFQLYKPNNMRNKDVTTCFFQPYNHEPKGGLSPDAEYNIHTQVRNYHAVKYDKLAPYIANFFNPTQEIQSIENTLLEKYSINFEKQKYCGVYYRGLDKKNETKLGTYDMYGDKMTELLGQNAGLQFIVQSDEKGFMEYTYKRFPDAIVLSDENPTATSNIGIHRLHTSDQNFSLIKTFFAIVLLLAKCQFLICSSGNCSMWMALYRGNASGIIQCLNEKWYDCQPEVDDTANNTLQHFRGPPDEPTRTAAEKQAITAMTTAVDNKIRSRKWMPRRGSQFK